MKLRILAICLVSAVAFFACKQNPDYTNEGTLTRPVTITVGVSHQGTVGKGGISYYQFAVGGGVYTIALTNTQSDLSWELYDDTWSFIDDCDDIWFAAGDEIKGGIALAGGTFYLTVTEYLGVDGTFTLTVY